MREALLIILLSVPFGLLAQSAGDDFSAASVVRPMSRDSVRYQVRKNELIEIDISIRETNLKIRRLGSLGLAAIPSIVADRQNRDALQGQNLKILPVNIGILSPLAALHLFNKHKKPKAYVEVKQYTTEGKLLSTSRVFDKGKSGLFQVSRNIEKDGFLIVSIENFGRKAISAKSTATNKVAYTPKHSVISGGGEPIDPDSDEPIAWENYLGGVTINGKGTFANADFIATYEAAFGPSETWIAVASASGGDGGGGGGGDGGGYEPASAEAKQEARELKKIQANECEAEYILDHFQSDPMILPKLITIRTYVKLYLEQHGMNAANNNGA